jgi:hypothetical protein
MRCRPSSCRSVFLIGPPNALPAAYPTFDRCPECSGMLWTDAETTGAWCSECDYSEIQTDLDL